MKRIIALCFVVAAIAAVLRLNSADTAATAAGVNLDGCNLLDVKWTGAPYPEQRVHYSGMEVSFNPEAHIPNWVAWELTADETAGSQPRHNRFEADPAVRGCATPDDYRYSGYDRGHMAPAADMKWSEKAMRESFLLTNICPQTHKLNSGSWKKLEEKCRVWATADSAVYIVCGPVLTDEITERIGASEVAVPRRFFKVIIAPYADPPRGIGFIMPNAAVPGGMQQAACSIDEVEAVTGMDFFSALPDSLENLIESQANFHQWSRVGI